MKKLTVRFILVALVAVLGLIGLKQFDKTKTQSADFSGFTPPPVVVESTKALKERWQKQIHVTGTLEPFQGVTIKSALVQGGIINKIHFTSGEEVTKGKSLFTIQPSNVTVAAPFSGKLGLKKVDVGDLVVSGTELVTLQQVDTLKVQFDIPQSYLAYLGLGQTIQVSTTAYPGKVFDGSVFAIDNHLDTDTRSITVWAELPNKDRKLYPGLFVDVMLYSDTSEAVVTVPQSAVVYAESGPRVFKIMENQAVQKEVKLGARKGSRIQLIEGVDAGDNIVLSGQTKVVNGSSLVVKNTDDQFNS